MQLTSLEVNYEIMINPRYNSQISLFAIRRPFRYYLWYAHHQLKSTGLQYTASNDRMYGDYWIIKDREGSERGQIWAALRVCVMKGPGNPQDTPVRGGGVPPDMRARDIPSASQNCCRLNQLSQWSALLFSSIEEQNGYEESCHQTSHTVQSAFVWPRM